MEDQNKNPNVQQPQTPQPINPLPTSSQLQHQSKVIQPSQSFVQEMESTTTVPQSNTTVEPTASIPEKPKPSTIYPEPSSATLTNNDQFHETEEQDQLNNSSYKSKTITTGLTILKVFAVLVIMFGSYMLITSVRQRSQLQSVINNQTAKVNAEIKVLNNELHTQTKTTNPIKVKNNYFTFYNAVYILDILIGLYLLFSKDKTNFSAALKCLLFLNVALAIYQLYETRHGLSSYFKYFSMSSVIGNEGLLILIVFTVYVLGKVNNSTTE